jgi:hypothetical protein
MPPLTVVVSLAAIAAVVGTFLHEASRVRTLAAERIDGVEGLLAAHRKEDLETMRVALVAIEQSGEFREALEAGDRHGLLEGSMPLFRRLQAETGITHFYYSGPDRVNLLRLHAPDQFGDVIDRFTTLEAERTQRPAHGTELGPLGTLTLRLVHPQTQDGRCIGYVELGHDLNHIADLPQTGPGMELGLFLEKGHLDRERWAERRRAREQDVNWDLLPDHVAMGAVPRDVPPETLARIVSDDFECGPFGERVRIEGRVLRLSCLPLVDAGGQDIGRVVVIVDTTDQEDALVRLLFFVTLACLAGGFVVLSLLRYYLGRVGRRVDGPGQLS